MNAIKKALYAGLGAAVITKDRLESALEDLVAQGKLAAPDARRFARKVVRDSRRELDELSDDLGTTVRDLAARSAAAANTRLRELEQRLEKFERATRAGRSSAPRGRRARPE